MGEKYAIVAKHGKTLKRCEARVPRLEKRATPAKGGKTYSGLQSICIVSSVRNKCQTNWCHSVPTQEIQFDAIDFEAGLVGLCCV